MCTAATYQTRDFYMGRTLDYELFPMATRSPLHLAIIRFPFFICRPFPITMQ